MSNLLRDHYRTLVEDRGFERPDFALGDVSAPEIERTFAAADRGRAFASRVDAGEPALVTSGVSMTGPPHVGTLGQILTAIRLQEAGLDVQLVLADLPAYLAAGRELNDVRALAGRYRSFAVELGFDERAGVLRTQLDAPGVLRTAMLLSRYYDPEGDADDDPDESKGDDGDGNDPDPESEPTAFEAELAAAYESAETPGVETPRFAGAQTGLLLAADTLHPVVGCGYKHVCFVGGSDNHGLSSFVRGLLDASPYAGTVAGLYTRLVPGLAGYPKMSKSLPRSNVSLDDDPATVRDRVLAADDGSGDAPVFEMMRVASPYTPAEFERVREAHERGGDEWQAAKRAYADFIADAAAVWG